MAKDEIFKMRMTKKAKEDLFRVAEENGKSASDYASEAIENRVKRHDAKSSKAKGM